MNNELCNEPIYYNYTVEVGYIEPRLSQLSLRIQSMSTLQVWPAWEWGLSGNLFHSQAQTYRVGKTLTRYMASTPGLPHYAKGKTSK